MHEERRQETHRRHGDCISLLEESGVEINEQEIGNTSIRELRSRKVVSCVSAVLETAARKGK
jgi:hypothetical protein